MSVYADASRPGLDETRAGRDARGSGIRGHRRALRRAQGARARTKSAQVFGAPRAHRASRAHRRSARSDRPLRATGSRASSCPELLGARGDAAVVPAPPDRAVQFIDARDLASWMLDMAERADGRHVRRVQLRRARGRWATLVDALVDERARGGQPDRGAVDRRRNRCSATASRRGPSCRCGFRRPTPSRRASCISPARGRSARGLAVRPLARDDRRHGGVASRSATTPRAWRNVLSAAKEREILADVAAAKRGAVRRTGRAIIARAAPAADRAFAMDRPTNAALLEFALRTAEAAGKAILPHFRAALDVEDKGGAKGYDPVTVADHAAEAVIRAEIARAYPDHGIRGEEHGTQRGASKLHVGDRPDRRHPQLHPRPDALGDADRAQRRRRRRRRRRAPAVRRRIVHGDGRAAARSGGAAASGARLQTRRCPRLSDAVVACTDPEDVRHRRASARRSTGSRAAPASPAGAAIATRIACSRWGSSTS